MGRSIRASKEGIAKAKEAFKSKCCTQDKLALESSCSRPIVIKFFKGEAIDKTKFQRICVALKLKYEEIIEKEEENKYLGRRKVTVSKLEENSSRTTIDSQLENLCQNPQITVVATSVLTTPVPKKELETSKATFVLSGTIDSVDEERLKAIEAHLREISGDAKLTILKVQSGSIKITVEGSPEGIERLAALFESGQLDEVLNIPVEDVEIIPTKEEKSRLIYEIKTQGARNRDLTGVDLSGADLRGVDFSNADLFCADLSGADLSDTNLSDANLSGTIFSHTNLINLLEALEAAMAIQDGEYRATALTALADKLPPE